MAGKNINSTEEIKKYFDIKQAETMKRFDAIDQRFDKVEDKIQILFEQAFSNTEDLTVIKGDLVEIKQGLRQKVSYGKFTLLEQRMDELEAKTAKTK